MGLEHLKAGKSGCPLGQLAMPSLLVVVIGLHVLAGKVREKKKNVRVDLITECCI
jgi:hypothetical protein